jgi:hypothetical protein
MHQFQINLIKDFLKFPLFQGHIERQVLVQNYEVGKSVAFDPRVRNLKEVYTSDGYKM